jgi:23S rRNA pseudouridine2605 synthase
MTAHESVRLQKFLADAGVCSRRAAETLIANGEVYVNGARAELGQKIVPGADKITVEGKPVRALMQPRLTLAVNKPRGVVCSNEDPHNPETIFSLLPAELARLRFFCAGRLDKDSEGLVILTTDGDLANRLMHPRHQVVKRYHVRLEMPFPRTKLPRLLTGVLSEGERLKVERAALLHPSGQASTELDVWMHHGKKREIRQLFLALGYPVKRLRRYQIGALQLRGIPLRAVKQLSTKEVDSLFRVPSAPLPEHRAAVTQTERPLPKSKPSA